MIGYKLASRKIPASILWLVILNDMHYFSFTAAVMCLYHFIALRGLDEDLLRLSNLGYTSLPPILEGTLIFALVH